MDAIFKSSLMTEPILPENLPADLPDEDVAENLVAQATKGFEASLSPMELTAIRDELVDRLLVTNAGRELLRQVRPDPSVTTSGDLAAPGTSKAELDEWIAAALGGRTKNGPR